MKCYIVLCATVLLEVGKDLEFLTSAIYGKSIEIERLEVTIGYRITWELDTQRISKRLSEVALIGESLT